MANALQIEQWNAAIGERWVRLQPRFDAAYAEYARRVVDAARLVPGESALDIGCGCGATTLAAGERVGPTGLVVGFDVSAPMLARARERAEEAELRHVQFEQADVQTAPLGTARFDVALSRFGVMFFDDPVRAFTSVRGALRERGRLVFAAWRSAAENPWISLPGAATAAFLEIERSEPGAPGPFAFAAPDRIRHILESAGFAHVSIDPLDLDVTFGKDPLEAAALLVQLGPVGRALSSASPELRARAEDAIAAALGPYTTSAGVVLGSHGWLVRAVQGA